VGSGKWVSEDSPLIEGFFESRHGSPTPFTEYKWLSGKWEMGKYKLISKKWEVRSREWISEKFLFIEGCLERTHRPLTTDH